MSNKFSHLRKFVGYYIFTRTERTDIVALFIINCTTPSIRRCQNTITKGLFIIKSYGYKLAVIGGDARQLIAAASFRRAGYEVALYGFSGNGGDGNSAVDSLCCSASTVDPREIIHNAADGSAYDCGSVCSTPEEALCGCDTVILPLPATGDGVRVSMPLGGEVITLAGLAGMMASAGVRFLCGGKLPKGFVTLCETRGIKVFDYYEREEFALANAIPTAEGALEIAMRELPVTVDGSSALVIGNGRIGKALSRILSALGANVTVSARRESDYEQIRRAGHTSAKTEKLLELFSEKRFDMIFNTVPHTVLGEGELATIRPGTLIVDLASRPGGVDIASADRLSHNVIWALSLPGKVAPVTSGRIIADTVLSCIGDFQGKE